MALMSTEQKIAIIGTGEFARALGSRLVQYGLEFSYGSRDPLRSLCGPLASVFETIHVKDIEDCCLDAGIIILAIHPAHYYDTLSKYERHLVGKTLVDVSNTSSDKRLSNAEKLAAMFPKCDVIKAFNTISSAMMCEAAHGRLVCVCGRSEGAKNDILRLASRLGFTPVDYGQLSRSLQLESETRRLFPSWGWPCVVVLVISTFWIIFTMCRHFKLRKDPYSLERLPTNMANKMLAAIAATCLCSAVIPGCLASFIQLTNGTKNIAFPRFIDEWLKMRQKLGLFALLFSTMHMVLSCMLISPAYFSKWYLQTEYQIYVNGTLFQIPITTRMNWIGETVILMGVLALATMCLLGVATSISGSLSWREWRFVYSHLGFVCVVFSACHITVKGAAQWLGNSAKDVIPTISFLSSVLPWLTIIMRLILYLPCVYRRVKVIRYGKQPTAHNKYHIKQHITQTNTSLNDGELSIVV